jgi:hypothetical protein
MTLTEQVAQFLYTHMAQAPNRKELLKIVQAGEMLYAERIQELEKKVAEKEGAKKQEEESDFVPRQWHDFD